MKLSGKYQKRTWKETELCVVRIFRVVGMEIYGVALLCVWTESLEFSRLAGQFTAWFQ
jgi:hypothetical protein